MAIHVSIADAARLLGIRQDTVLRRIRSGQLRAYEESTPEGFVWQVELAPEDVAEAVARRARRVQDRVQEAVRQFERQAAPPLEQATARQSPESKLERRALAATAVALGLLMLLVVAYLLWVVLGLGVGMAMGLLRMEILGWVALAGVGTLFVLGVQPGRCHLGQVGHVTSGRSSLREWSSTWRGTRAGRQFFVARDKEAYSLLGTAPWLERT